MPAKTQTPKGWRLVRLGEVAELGSGKSPIYNNEKGTVAVLGANGRIGLTDRSNCSSGIAVGRVGASGSVSCIRERVWLSDNVLSVEPSSDICNLSFLYRALVNANLPQLASKTAQPLLTQTNLGAVRLSLPPLPEQRAIAAVLDSIDDAIEGAEAVIAATGQLRDSLLHQLLTRGVPGWHTQWKEAPGLGTIPAGWEVVRLGEVAEVRSGVGFPLDRQGHKSGDYPFIKVSDMTLQGNEKFIRLANNYVTQQEAKELGAVPFTPGTVVFPKVGAAIATNKKRALTVPTIIDNNMVGITAKDRIKCDAHFLHNWFESIDLEQFANVSAVPSITGSRLQREFIPHPPLSEQQAIAALLDGVDVTLERARTERDGLQLLKESTADALLTGRVRVAKTEVKELLHDTGSYH